MSTVEERPEDHSLLNDSTLTDGSLLSGKVSKGNTVATPVRKSATTEREVMFDEFAETPNKPASKRRSGTKKRRSAGPKKGQKVRRKRTDDESAEEVWEDTLVDEVIDYLSPEEETDEEDTFASLESEPPTILSYFLLHGRAKQDLFEELQDVVFEKLGCCAPDDWEVSDDEDESTDGGESFEARDRKAKVQKKRAQRMARWKAKRAAAKAERRNRIHQKRGGIQVQLSMDEESHGLEAMACFDFKGCVDACADDAVCNDIIEGDENDTLDGDKMRIQKSKGKNGKPELNVYAAGPGEKKTKKSFRGSMQYLTSLLRLNRDPRLGGKKLVVKTSGEHKKQRSVEGQREKRQPEVDYDSDSWVDTSHLKPITEADNEDTTVETTTVQDSRSLGSTRRDSFDSGDPDATLPTYSKPIMHEDELGYGEMMTKNFKKFRKEHFPGMSTDAIVGEFNEFLKQRGLSKDAKDNVLSKVQFALACQDVDENTVLTDEFDDTIVSNSVTADKRTDPPPSSEEIFESAIELFSDGNTKVMVDEAVVGEILMEKPPEPQKPVDQDKSTVVMGNNKKGRKQMSFRRKLQSRISKSRSFQEKEEEGKPPAPESVVSEEGLEEASTTEHSVEEVMSSKQSEPRSSSKPRLSAVGLARSLSFWGKNKKSKKEPTVAPMASANSAGGDFTKHQLSTPSKEAEDVGSITSEKAAESKVNIFNWANGDGKPSQQSPSDEPAVATPAPVEQDPEPIDLGQSNKAKRRAWRTKNSPQKAPVPYQPEQKNSLVVRERSAPGPVSQGNGDFSKRSQSTPLSSSSVDDEFDRLMSQTDDDDDWADFSHFGNTSSPSNPSKNNESTMSPMGVDEFDSLMSSHAVADDWDDIVSQISVNTPTSGPSAWSPSELGLATPETSNKKLSQRDPAGYSYPPSTPKTEQSRIQGVSPSHVSGFPQRSSSLIQV